MTLLEKLESDLLIAQSELKSISELIEVGLNKEGFCYALQSLIKAKIDSINSQILKLKSASESRPYVDRRDGRYTC